MKKTVVKDLPEKYRELASYIEALQFEVASRRSLLAFAIEKGLRKRESFAEYETEYREFFVKYEQAKEEFGKTAVTELFGPVDSWDLDFATKRITAAVNAEENK